jgi:hypothetical protein
MSKETPQSHNQVSAEKDEFHSVASAQASDDEAEPDTATVNGLSNEGSHEEVISDLTQSDPTALKASELVSKTEAQESAPKPEHATLEETKSVSENGTHRALEPTQSV